MATSVKYEYPQGVGEDYDRRTELESALRAAEIIFDTRMNGVYAIPVMTGSGEELQGAVLNILSDMPGLAITVETPKHLRGTEYILLWRC